MDRRANGDAGIAGAEADLHTREGRPLQHLRVGDAVQGEATLEEQRVQVGGRAERPDLVGRDGLDHVLGQARHAHTEVELLTLFAVTPEDLVEEGVIRLLVTGDEDVVRTVLMQLHGIYQQRIPGGRGP